MKGPLVQKLSRLLRGKRALNQVPLWAFLSVGPYVTAHSCETCPDYTSVVSAIQPQSFVHWNCFQL